MLNKTFKLMEYLTGLFEYIRRLKQLFHVIHGLKQKFQEFLGVCFPRRDLGGDVKKDAVLIWHHIWHSITVIGNRTKPSSGRDLWGTVKRYTIRRCDFIWCRVTQNVFFSTVEHHWVCRVSQHWMFILLIDPHHVHKFWFSDAEVLCCHLLLWLLAGG